MGSKESKEAEVESPGDTQVSKADIQAEVAASMIVIYVSKSCLYCQTAIKALSASGFEAKIIDANTSQKSVSAVYFAPKIMRTTALHNEELKRCFNNIDTGPEGNDWVY